MRLDKRVVVEWVSCRSAYFTIIAQSHNFDKAFLVNLAICHLQCKSTLSRCIYATRTPFFFNGLAEFLSRLGNGFWS